MSLNQTTLMTPVLALPSCPSCASTRVSTVMMTLTDNSHAEMSACRNCEKTSWRDRNGDRLPLQLVLDRATKPGAAGLNLLARSAR